MKYVVLPPHNGRTVVVGDVHACYRSLRHLLGSVEWQEGTDRLIFVGDIVDRGFQPLETLRFLHRLDPVLTHIVMGNHDERLIRWARGHPVSLEDGLDIAIDMAGDWVKDHVKWLDAFPQVVRLPDAYGRKRFVVHAGVNPTVSIDEQKERDLIYMRALNSENYFDELSPMWWTVPGVMDNTDVIYGHTPLDDAEPAPRVHRHPNGAAYYGIDGGCVFYGRLIAAVYECDEPEPRFVVVQGVL